jgi:hypothetical protein
MTMTVEISDIMEFVDTALQTEGVERVVIDGIVDEGPLALFVVFVDGIVTEFYADPDETREPIDYFYANQQLLEETYNVDIEAVPEDDLEVNIVFHKRRVLSPETLYRDGTITRDAFAYVQNRYTDGANIAVTGSDLKSINAFINYLLESVSHPPKTVVIDSCSGFVFGVDNDALIIISGYDSNIFSMVCQMDANRIFTADKLSEEDAAFLHEAMDTDIKFVAAMPDDGNGYVTTEEVNHFDLEIEIELVEADEPIRVKSIREISSKDKPTFTNISQYVNGQHIVTI